MKNIDYKALLADYVEAIVPSQELLEAWRRRVNALDKKQLLEFAIIWEKDARDLADLLPLINNK